MSTTNNTTNAMQADRRAATTAQHTPGPWITRKSSDDDMQINGTEAWSEVHEIISAPNGKDAVDALFVGFILKPGDGSVT